MSHPNLFKLKVLCSVIFTNSATVHKNSGVRIVCRLNADPIEVVVQDFAHLRCPTDPVLDPTGIRTHDPNRDELRLIRCVALIRHLEAADEPNLGLTVIENSKNEKNVFRPNNNLKRMKFEVDFSVKKTRKAVVPCTSVEPIQ
jgi:hypothetical protein